MHTRRDRPGPPKERYLEKAKALTSKETELLQQRIRGRFARRREDKSYSAMEILALQLEFEDTQLDAWRNGLTRIRTTRE